jgi:tripartite-type tricarboxylate transporter receptor subunit TctC
MSKRWTLKICTALWLGLSLVGSALAQSDWPSRPIKIIVPTPPGGAYDRTIRPIAQELALQLKQPVVIDNRAGAGNIVGAAVGAKSAPDGYTLTMTGMVNTMAASLYDNVPFDIVGDFAHVASFGEGAQWLVVRSDAGINSLAELLERARKEPGKLNYATSGAGSTGHLLMELLQRATGTTLTHVPYKGGAPALQDVLGGVLPITVVPPSGAEMHVKAGKLKVLAVSSEKRTKTHPDVPTFAELGHKSLTVTSWVGLSAPKGTPAPIVRRLHTEVMNALAKPALLAQLEAEGMIPMVLGPEAYSQLVRSDTERWTGLIRSLNLKAN